MPAKGVRYKTLLLRFGSNHHEAYERLTQVATSAEVSLGEFLERAVFLEHEPYERLTHMAAQARASEAQFLEHLILRAEAIYNLQPPVLPPPRPCRPSWATCVTLLDHLGILVGLSSSRPPAPLPCIQALAVLARTAQLPVRREHLVVAALAGPFWDLECSVEFAVPVGVWSAVLVDQVLVPFGESGVGGGWLAGYHISSAVGWCRLAPQNG